MCVCVYVCVLIYTQKPQESQTGHASLPLHHTCTLVLYLHGEGGVDSVVEVQVGGAVVGPVGNPQVTVSDPTVQLLLDGVFLQPGRQIRRASRDSRADATRWHSLSPGWWPTCTHRDESAASCTCPAFEACLVGWDPREICHSYPDSRLSHCGCLSVEIIRNYY